MDNSTKMIRVSLDTVQFWILYLLAWHYYQSLLAQGVQDDEWREILLCLQ